MSDQTNSVTNATINATLALLETIKSGTKSTPAGVTSGATFSSLAAQALRDLLSTPALAEVVAKQIRKEGG